MFIQIIVNGSKQEIRNVGSRFAFALRIITFTRVHVAAGLKRTVQDGRFLRDLYVLCVFFAAIRHAGEFIVVSSAMSVAQMFANIISIIVLMFFTLRRSILRRSHRTFLFNRPFIDLCLTFPGNKHPVIQCLSYKKKKKQGCSVKYHKNRNLVTKFRSNLRDVTSSVFSSATL